MNNIFNKFYLGFALILSITTYAHYNSRGPYGGSVTCSIIGDTNVYIGTENGGVYRSTNRNVIQWRPVPLGLKSGRITSLAFTGGTLFAATADSGIFVSANAGGIWAPGNAGLTDKRVKTVMVKGNTIFAGTESGIFRSETGTLNWESVRPGAAVTAMTHNGTMIIAATSEGIYTSADGTSWTPANALDQGIKVNQFLFHTSGLFAATSKGIFFATPGSGWNSFSTGLPSVNVSSLVILGESVYAATDSGFATSPVGTPDWTFQQTGIKTKAVKALSWFGKFIAGTHKEGIYTSPNPASGWILVNSGFNNLATYASLAIDTNIIMAATEKGLFISRNVATSYIASNKGLEDSLNITSLAFSGRRLYASTRTMGVYVSSDTGKSWSQFRNAQLPSGIRNIILYKDSIAALSFDNTVYISTAANPLWVLSTGINDSITSLATNGTSLFAAAESGPVYILKNQLWVLLNSPLANVNIISLAANNDFIIAATETNVYRANLQTLSDWELMGGVLPEKLVNVTFYSDVLFAGIRSGAYYSTDFGHNWEPAGTQDNYPTFADARTISFVGNGRATTGRIFLTTSYNSLYSNSLSEIPVALGLSEKSVKKADFLFLHPNPSSGSFSVRSTEELKELTVLDQAGRSIMSLPSVQYQTVEMKLPGGLYFIKAESYKGTAVQKLIVR